MLQTVFSRANAKSMQHCFGTFCFSFTVNWMNFGIFNRSIYSIKFQKGFASSTTFWEHTEPKKCLRNQSKNTPNKYLPNCCYFRWCYGKCEMNKHNYNYSSWSWFIWKSLKIWCVFSTFSDFKQTALIYIHTVCLHLNSIYFIRLVLFHRIECHLRHLTCWPFIED